MSQSRIAELASAVAQHTQRVDSYLTENNLPQPSFDANGPVHLRLPADIEKSRIAALQASQELNDLLRGPRELIFDLEVYNTPAPEFIKNKLKRAAQYSGSFATDITF